MFSGESGGVEEYIFRNFFPCVLSVNDYMGARNFLGVEPYILLVSLMEGKILVLNVIAPDIDGESIHGYCG